MNPCTNCKDRFLGCEDNCKKYIEYLKNINKSQLAKEQEEKDFEDLLWIDEIML